MAVNLVIVDTHGKLEEIEFGHQIIDLELNKSPTLSICLLSDACSRNSQSVAA